MTDNEKTVLEKLYDELRAELSTTQLNCDMWHDRAEDMRNRLLAKQAENAKLREFASEAFSMAFNFYHGAGTAEDLRELEAEYHELGIEVNE